MFKIAKRSLLTFVFFIFNFSTLALSEIVKNIEISGNDRISDQTILMFSDIKVGKNLNPDDLNELLKLLYDSNFFEDVSLTLKENKLKIIVKENPIIENINYNGVKSNSLLEEITKDLLLKPRTSFNKNFLKMI